MAALCVLAVIGWQALVVHYDYGGNWTGLYCIGDRFPWPPDLHETLWLFPDSDGYDGQWYHLIAHDPWLRRGLYRWIDNPRLRYPRILLPGLAHLLAAGQDRYIDAAYLLLTLLSIFFGSFWISRCAARSGLTSWLGLAFPVAPAVLVSIDRLVVDSSMACLCAGFVYFAEAAPGWPMYLVLLAAPLVRDTGFVLLAGYLAALILERRLRRAAVFATAALPAIAWAAFVSTRLAPANPIWIRGWPLAGYIDRVMHPTAYPFIPTVAFAATALDYLALAGMGLAIVWALVLFLDKTTRAGSMPIIAFAAAAAMLNLREIWEDAYSFGRVLTPLLLLLAMAALPKRKWAMTLPLLLVIPRVAMQFAAPTYYALRAMIGAG